VQEAKQRFSALIQCAIDEGPQIVTKHGEPIVVVMTIEEYARLNPQRKPFNEFLLDIPDLPELDLVRDCAPAREIEF
jgi:prevent-host-death family protein